MSNLRGFADYFPKIKKIEAEKVASMIGFKGSPKLLENRIANRILYSHAIAATREDLVFDLAILYEAIRVGGDFYYSKSQKKIFIPEGLLDNFPNEELLIKAFTDVLRPQNGTEVVIKHQK